MQNKQILIEINFMFWGIILFLMTVITIIISTNPFELITSFGIFSTIIFILHLTFNKIINIL